MQMTGQFAKREEDLTLPYNPGERNKRRNRREIGRPASADRLQFVFRHTYLQ